jgi:antirestriction protein ArdC
MSSTKETFQKIENRIIEFLERGHIPWQKAFDINYAPVNAKTGNYYSGFNLMLLEMLSFSEPYFMGFRQAQDLGGTVRKGERGMPILFPTPIHRDRETGKRISAKKAESLPAGQVKTHIYYNCGYVWNISQCEDIDRAELPEISEYHLDFEPIQRAEQVISGWKDCPAIEEKGGRAFYHKEDDFVRVPEKGNYRSREHYYGVLFHELVHATGAPKRLDREKGDYKYDQKYCFEELVAEFGSALLCGHCGIEKPLIENKSAYIESWLKALKEHSEGDWIVKACKQAREAVEYIISNEAKELKKAS